MIDRTALFVGAAFLVLTAVGWQGAVCPSFVAMGGRRRHHHHHHRVSRHRRRHIGALARADGSLSNAPRPRVAILLRSGVCDFIEAARALLAKGRFDGRFFALKSEKVSSRIKEQVAAWRPAAIVSFGRGPDGLLKNWSGIPILRLYRRSSSGPSAGRSGAGSAWHTLPFVAGPSQVLVGIKRLSPARVVVVGQRVSPWIAALHKLGMPGATIESSRAETLVARLGEFDFKRGDVLVLTHEPTLFSSLVLLELVRLQLDRNVTVVGFSRRQVGFGLAVAAWYSTSDYGKTAADALVSYLATRQWRTKRSILRWSYNEAVQRATSGPKLGRPVGASMTAGTSQRCSVVDGQKR